MANSSKVTILGGTAGGPVWSQPNADFTKDLYTVNNTSSIAPMSVNQGGKITLKGQDADVDINGMSLKNTLKGIQERLGILEVNKELESEFEQLQELGRQYREMEAQLLEQKAVFDILKNKNI
jgi:hypothetical protein